MQPSSEKTPRRTLIMVPGGGYKPDPAARAALWIDALAAGLGRDFADAGGPALLDGVQIVVADYADLVNPVAVRAGAVPDADLDLTDRRRDFERLRALSSSRKFRRIYYEAVPGKSAVPEMVADVAAPVLNALGLADPVLARILPVLSAYLSTDSALRDACERRLMEHLAPALTRGDHVLLLSHGFGSVVSYDALWRLSHDSGPASAGRVHTWLTCGSPLASSYVKQRLRGTDEPAARRYPDKLVSWYNVAAEDDFHCHDKTVADDFAALLRQQRASRIRDYRIYNLAVRYGRSNPHNAVGYLIHPRVTGLVADWLTGAQR